MPWRARDFVHCQLRRWAGRPQLKGGSTRPSSATRIGLRVRKQYYFRPSSRGLLGWDVDRLIQLSSQLPRKQVRLADIRELDEVWDDEEKRPTWRAIVEHMTLIDQADLSFPIILSSSGAIMDGRHRVAKALREGRLDITAVQFERDPDPDHVGVAPEDLPY